MKVYFTAVIFCIKFPIIKALDKKSENVCYYNLHIFNDGPVTLDVPVTISAFLTCADEEDEHLYIFEDDTDREIVVRGHQSATVSFVFSDYTGTRIIKVKAYVLFPKKSFVGSSTTIVQVHEYIPGELRFSDNVTDKEGHLYVPADKDINITLTLTVPHQILTNSEFSYFWNIGDLRFTSSVPYLIRRFLIPGPQSIHASAVARIPFYNSTGLGGYRWKWGHFGTQLMVKNPFQNINITGNTYLQHGQLLNLDISCNGSGPIDFCWKVLPPSENITNFSCNYPITVLECHFPITYYFRESGVFLLVISVNNLVSNRQRSFEIRVYDVSTVPQLSTIIIPVVCTVLVLLIVVSAVVIHIRRTRSFDIETADFDFMIAEESGTVAAETSWEHMHRTFLQLLRIPYIYYSTEVQKLSYGSVISD